MAYIIGNTTVIDNNGALGAVSGNNLNLANNANISAGGGGIKILTSSSNFPDTDLGSAGAIAVMIGGGGGNHKHPSRPLSPGGRGGMIVTPFSISGNASVTATVASAGNSSNSYNVGSNPGGSSYVNYSGIISNSAGGGGGVYGYPDAYTGNPGGGMNNNSGWSQYGGSTQSGFIGILGA